MEYKIGLKELESSSESVQKGFNKLAGGNLIMMLKLKQF